MWTHLCQRNRLPPPWGTQTGQEVEVHFHKGKRELRRAGCQKIPFFILLYFSSLFLAIKALAHPNKGKWRFDEIEGPPSLSELALNNYLSTTIASTAGVRHHTAFSFLTKNYLLSTWEAESRAILNHGDTATAPPMRDNSFVLLVGMEIGITSVGNNSLCRKKEIWREERGEKEILLFFFFLLAYPGLDPGPLHWAVSPAL